MEQKEKKTEKVIFPEMRNIHITGIIMVILLLFMAGSAIEMIAWTILKLVNSSLGYQAFGSGHSIVEQKLMELYVDFFIGQGFGETFAQSAGMGWIQKTGKLILAASNSATVMTVIWLAAVVILLCILNKQSVKAAECYKKFSGFCVNPAAAQRTSDMLPGPMVSVKKIPYILLGFLLGTFGGHFFLIRREGKISKRAILFLILGICGIFCSPLMIYTTGISFADAWVGCRLKKDERGYIQVVDYNRFL